MARTSHELNNVKTFHKKLRLCLDFISTKTCKRKVGTKWDKICTIQISIFRKPLADPFDFI